MLHWSVEKDVSSLSVVTAYTDSGVKLCSSLTTVLISCWIFCDLFDIVFVKNV